MTRRVGRIREPAQSGGSDHATHAGVQAGRAARFAAALDRAKDGAATVAAYPGEPEHRRDPGDLMRSFADRG